MMDVKIQSVNFGADKKLVEFINNKIAKLEKFAEDAICAHVTMKTDKDSEKNNKVVTMKLDVPGNDLVAEFKSKTFEEAIDECIEAIKKQLEKHKAR